ncbi:hypothetical protein RWE15_15850 [Virgibacillus halophilus]|uniref:Activator of Hsp90 ATPase homolog 1-like protein n=1 Tax=Tigheibacillus halophilus TaxID=361280 RepID=A0ABU5C8I5_9BACI|nr:hypothetical protein [Virgibacillus halophilus]
MTITPTKTLSVSIERKANEVYEFILNPENLPQWAPAFGQSIKKI